MFLAALVLLGPGLKASDFQLGDGDRVLFYGETGPAERLFTADIETYALTRFPYRTVTFLHGGWGGEAASSYNPSVVLLLMGLDRGPCGGAEAFDAWVSRQRRTMADLRRNVPGARVTLVRPTPCPDAAARERMAGFVKELGGSVDLDTPLAAAVARARETDRGLAEAIAADPFRPGPAGHLLLAQFLLASWHAPAQVSALEADGVNAEFRRAENVDAREFVTEPFVNWLENEEALPMPFEFSDPAVWLAALSSGFVEALNQQHLRVTGLTSGRYRLKFDGEPVAVFSKYKLDEGVNLALLVTPMSRQAGEVHALTLKRHELLAARRRGGWTPALEKQDAEIVERQRLLARPRLHDCELEPVE